ncbi:VanZ family protein [uncultured Campylobacter sp.]|uniref:VanZ family protein n=1 Tax=uncultured Campylobacter sp. TaxID=218934 RepID=UPI003211C48D
MNLSKISAAFFFMFLIAIEYLALTPAQIKLIENSWDKANHFIAFAALYVTLHFGFSRLNLGAKVAILLAYGIQIEVAQSFVPNRYFSLPDIVADGIGIVFGILLARILERILDRFRAGF